jgi:uncharacterized protein YndB with AHSA1/START domain
MAVGADPQTQADREVVVSRIIEGPRELVFDAFTDVTNLGKWWVARNGSSITTHTFEFRPGGVWDATIHAGGSDFPNYIVWKEIAPPERIVWLYYGAGRADPNPVTTTLTLADHGATTEATLRLVFGSKAQRDEMVAKYHAAAGARQALDALAGYVEGSR